MDSVKTKLKKAFENNKVYIDLSIRTGIAVGLCVFATKRLSLESPFYASLAAFITMEVDHKESLYKGLMRLVGTVFGAILAIAMISIGFVNYFAIGIGIAIIIYLAHFLSVKPLKNVACIVFVAIMYNIKPEVSPLEYTFYRFIDTIIGVAIATSIAYLSRVPIKSIIKKLINHKENNKSS